jgi:hypothetical protein
MRSSRRRNGLLSRAVGRMHGRRFPFRMLHRALLSLLVFTLSAWAEEEVVWEPAQILAAEQIAESGGFLPLAIPTFFDNFRYPFLQENESVVFIANDGGRGGTPKPRKTASAPSASF